MAYDIQDPERQKRFEKIALFAQTILGSIPGEAKSLMQPVIHRGLDIISTLEKINTLVLPDEGKFPPMATAFFLEEYDRLEIKDMSSDQIKRIKIGYSESSAAGFSLQSDESRNPSLREGVFLRCAIHENSRPDSSVMLQSLNTMQDWAQSYESLPKMAIADQLTGKDGFDAYFSPRRKALVAIAGSEGFKEDSSVKDSDVAFQVFDKETKKPVSDFSVENLKFIGDEPFYLENPALIAFMIVDKGALMPMPGLSAGADAAPLDDVATEIAEGCRLIQKQVEEKYRVKPSHDLDEGLSVKSPSPKP